MRRQAGRGQVWRLVFVLPAFAVFAVFVLWPLTQTVRYSMYDWDGIAVARPVGLRNYVLTLTDPAIRDALGHSLVFVLFYALLPAAIGMVIAGIFARIKVHGMTVFRALLFVPQVLATVVVAVSWRWIYADDGPLNKILELVGLGGIARAWLGDFTTALPAVGLVGTWIMYGLCMVLFIAGVQKIPRELFEAARIDGAGPVREFFAVTVPQLRGELMVALVFTTTFALRNFDIVWNTTSGGPGDTTKVASVFIYQDAFVTRDIGSASAVGVLLTVLILIVTGGIMLAFKERNAS